MKQNPFPHQKRLTQSHEFFKVFKYGRGIVSGCLFLKFFKTEGSQSRLGITVAKKKVSKAVSRNQIKRIIRESFRLSTLSEGIDVVVTVNSGFDKLSPKQQREAIDFCWKKIP